MNNIIVYIDIYWGLIGIARGKWNDDLRKINDNHHERMCYFVSFGVLYYNQMIQNISQYLLMKD